VVHDDVFRVLGVPRGADDETVKKAYRALAAHHHPDRNPGDPGALVRFERINRAYATWRAAHDPTAKPADDVYSSFSELFSSVFGKPQTTARGADRTQTIKLSYGEARDGCTRYVSVVRKTLCSRCGGTGAERGITHPCAACAGKGQRQLATGYFMVHASCRDCNGTGRFAESPCDSCDHGLCEEPETIQVPIPARVEPGHQLHCAGKGDAVFGGQAGDLHFTIEVDTIGVLVRRGDDVVLETLVGARHLLFGGSLEVATLDGHARVAVPRGVRDGDTVTLPDRGHVRASASGGGDPYRELGRGDQIVVFRVPADAARTRVRVVLGTVVTLGISVLAAVLAI
jgi:molecular chaperone DnaJ